MYELSNLLCLVNKDILKKDIKCYYNAKMSFRSAIKLKQINIVHIYMAYFIYSQKYF